MEKQTKIASSPYQSMRFIKTNAILTYLNSLADIIENLSLVWHYPEGNLLHVEKQSVEVFCKKGALRNFTKFTGKHLCQSFFFNKFAGLYYQTLLKNRFWHKCFPVNFAKFLRISFLQNISGRLLLNIPEMFWNGVTLFYNQQFFQLSLSAA